MKLKTFIKETVREELRRLYEDSDGFSMDELQTCETLDAAGDYLYSTLERAGEGYYRITYGLDENTVIKFAKEEVSQNAQEFRNSKCLPKRYVVQVLDRHPEFWWIVMERLQPLSIQQFVSEFEKKIGSQISYKSDGKGYDMENKESVIMMAIEVGAGGARNKNHNQWMANEWYAGLIAALRKCQVQADDFHHKNWGIRPGTGELVLLDLGF